MTPRLLLEAAGSAAKCLGIAGWLSACSASSLSEPDGGMTGSPGSPAPEPSGGACPTCVGGAGGPGISGGFAPSAAGGSVATAAGGSCAPGDSRLGVVDCGYPYVSSNPLTSVIFDENEMLRTLEVEGGSEAVVRLFFNDEHALTLGVRSVTVVTQAGVATTDYSVSPLLASPSSVLFPQTGTSELMGNFSGLDQWLRPMWPALFITDITGDPNGRAGDWQQGGTELGPSAVFGTWKAAVRTVDETMTPSAVTIRPDLDPAENHWNLGPAADPVPSGVTVDEGYGAEVRWNLSLVPGHLYRIQVMVHDCDRERIGVSAGEVCLTFCA